jgi:hypothetical protein
VSDLSPHRAGRGLLLGGGIAMLVLAILLSWLPVFGPLIAGGVGGWLIRDGRVALLVALVPAVLFAAFIAAVLVAFELPLLGAVAGAAVFLVVAVQVKPLLVRPNSGGALRL